MKLQTLDDFEELAFSCLNDAWRIRDTDIETARRYFALAWGVYMHFENTELMRVCERSLQSTGLDKDSIKPYKKQGFQGIGKVLAIYETLAETQARRQ
jgi:hypothetical protein